jgi:hypothetical protein
VVAVEELEEGRLGAGRALDAAEAQGREDVLQVARLKSRSWSHRLARLPTVVAWAGW